MPETITAIRQGAFWDCSALATVNYPGSEEEWKYITIEIENEPLIKAFANASTARTKTTISTDGKTFTVTPVNVETGKTIILALYNGEKFVGMKSAIYNGEGIAFATDKAYTKAKVMVWDDCTTLKPICYAEELN